MLTRILIADIPLYYKVIFFLISVAVVMISLTVHEYAHGYAAYRLGDSTAKADGRLSLNPLHHLDPIGTLMMLLIGFGYAKPVPVITRNFRKPRRDFAIVSLCGPLSNFVLAFVASFLYMLLIKVCPYSFWSSAAGEIVGILFYYMILINIGLGLFNLIPLPPLDGSNVLMCMLPPRLAAKYSKLRYYSQYILLGIILLSWLPGSAGKIFDYIFWPLDWLREAIYTGFTGFWAMIFGL